MSNQKMIIALLGVVAVLLAVIVGVLLFKSPSSDIAAVDPNALPPTTTTGTGTPAPTPAPAGPFDPAKATKVVGDPKAHVDKYFSAIVKKDWKTAYDLLPVDKKASYGSADSFGQQLASYGANGYKMGAVQTKGDQETVSATLETSGGGFTYNWTFVKYNGTWVVKSREIGGMGQ
jgi:hypothetical protein